MNFKTLLLCLCVNLSSPGFSQDSTVPESVRLMIQQSQASSPYEQMAKMQVEVQYREFLNALAGDASRKVRVEAEIVSVLAARAELSARVTNGLASSSDLLEISDYGYLRGRLEPLLSAAELGLLDNRRDGPSDAQLKKEYAEELTRVAGTLSAANQDLILDTLVKHVQRGQNNSTELGQLTVDDLVSQQMRSFMQAQQELQGIFSGEELQAVYNFINQLQSNLYRNRSMSDLAQ